ncbi:hypothetical protein D3876_09930 [Sphingomonas cavernae]|uniref:Uncharacterized protein n=2 Tax=Sphingomonas cavernae TaxID=2320861 RepID=A0A418WL22_9SPHN|nr:hypothetical protein D3876_09930 [Sphingomonas cavernae]
MLLTISATAAVLTGVPAIAGEPATTRFEHDGYSYVYKTRESAGRKIITGHRFPGNSPFRLVVNGDRVSGISDGRPVSFKLSEVERFDSGEQLAVR